MVLVVDLKAECATGRVSMLAVALALCFFGFG
jgi:hypothetical protein